VLAAIQAVGAPEPPVRLTLPAKSKRSKPCTMYRLNKRLGIKQKRWQMTKKTRKAIRTVQRRYGVRQTGYAGWRVSRILHLKGCHR